jgi:GDP/UDP-N,N'-diacetylbacillosamine 2-epimerase (hydrolysing)
MKTTVAIFTASRAEYGLLYPLIDALHKDPRTDAMVFVGGSHLTMESGRTIREIQADDVAVTDRFDYLLNDTDSATLSRSLGIATMELARLFDRYPFDSVCALGDRYELLAIVSCAILFRKPIFHIHGGESTHGLIDEQIRHMVTKAAHLHFVTCAIHADNLRRMGEPEWRIHNTGALAIDRIRQVPSRSRQGVFSELGLDPQRPAAVVTYHPVTLEMHVEDLDQINQLFGAMRRFPFQWVVTAPNIEIGRDTILDHIHRRTAENSDIHYVESLGAERYYGLIPHCEMVIGNSSSGILEVPYFQIPTVNVGDRQAGRTRHNSIIDTGYSEPDIAAGIQKALSPEFRQSLRTMEFQFGDGHAAPRMVDIIARTKIDQNLLRKRLEWSVE